MLMVNSILIACIGQTLYASSLYVKTTIGMYWSSMGIFGVFTAAVKMQKQDFMWIFISDRFFSLPKHFASSQVIFQRVFHTPGAPGWCRHPKKSGLSVKSTSWVKSKPQILGIFLREVALLSTNSKNFLFYVIFETMHPQWAHQISWNSGLLQV